MILHSIYCKLLDVVHIIEVAVKPRVNRVKSLSLSYVIPSKNLIVKYSATHWDKAT